MITDTSKEKTIDVPTPVNSLRAGFELIPSVKVMINIGAGFDIPTGTFIEGSRGEYILNGGLGSLTGVVGIGNNFKTTMLWYMMLMAMSRMYGSHGNMYDTEINIHEWHVLQFIMAIKDFEGEDIISNGRLDITDKTLYLGGAYWDKLKEYLMNKIKARKTHLVKTPFFNRDRKGNLEILRPTFSLVDSLSEFVTEDVVKMQNDNTLGESGANTVSMRQGLQKNRFLQEIPALAGGAYNYTLFSAHIGETINMDPYSPPAKKLQYLQKMKIKGVPEKFTFLMNNCWWAHDAKPLVNKDKVPKYPRDGDDSIVGETDLNLVRMLQLRSKSGKTGVYLEVIVSQSDGVLPTLTEFHYLDSMDRFGFEGNLQNYSMTLLPDVKLSRTTVRGKIDSNPKLCRAINITSELCQLYEHHRNRYADVLCSPKELYDDLKAMGYDWDVLFNTRGYWVVDDMHPLPFLSTMDLLRMRKGLYTPYWLKK